MGLGFLPWEKLPPKLRGLPFVFMGVLALVGLISQKSHDLFVWVLAIVMILIGPVVFVCASVSDSENEEKTDAEESKQ